MDPTPEEIRDQLNHILQSQEFQSSERMADFLRFVVEETLAGRASGINQRSVGIQGLAYPPNFDPLTNPAVRIQARRLRRALERYYFTVGRNDPIHIDMPKGRYVPFFSVNTSQETPPEAQAIGAETAPNTDNRFASLPEGPSIAVLSFAYLGNDEKDAYLASGLTEEIIIALTRFPDFLVVGPLSRQAAPEQGERVRQIGSEYEVRFVLDGTIRKRGDTLRVTAKLTDTASGENIWGHALDNNLEAAAIQEIENEVVGQVAASIADSYGVIPRTLMMESFAEGGETLSDYEAVLRFYHNIRVLTNESHTNALNALESTLQRDPNNARAAAMLGDLTAATYQFGFDDSLALLDRAEELGRRALALDPNSQQAHFTMALVHFLKFRRNLFIEETERCLGLNPNHALYLAALALHLGMAGDWDRGSMLMEKAMRLNPHHPGWYHLVQFMVFYRRGEYDLALSEAHNLNIPQFHWDQIARGAALGQLQREAEAQKVVAELLALVPDFSTRGRSIIRRFAFLDEHEDMLVDGLEKAGMEFAE